MILINKHIPHTHINLTAYTTDTEESAGVRFQCAGEATRMVRAPINKPNPDLRYLELRAQRRRAQRRAFKTKRTEDI
ncbi:unnamed protein product, partial [Ixodes hexagonus]